MELQVIYQDNDLVVVNKPPGVSAHGGDSVTGPTVTDFLLANFPEIAGVGEDPRRPAAGEARSFYKNERPGIVHRLDKNTSGVMVVAKNQKTFLALKEIFAKRRAEKTYWAICCGAFKEKSGIIDLPIGRLVANPLKRGVEQGSRKIRGAREAVTEFKVLKKGDLYSLVELRPQTGRMHQLRVHMAAIHHPIACDTLYGGKNVCCPASSGRQLLHARSLSFSYPEGRKLFFEADTPEDISIAMKNIS